MSNAIKAGDLRHRVAIQQRVETQDPTTGDISFTWQTVAGWDKVPAAIKPLSAREFIAAQQTNSEVTGRIVIRYRAGLNAKMRFLHGSTAYNIAGVLPDMDSGLEYITFPVGSGVNEG
jgi:SPP1 family predicted phage head-tail adaptor